jgi:hypothetical protein
MTTEKWQEKISWMMRIESSLDFVYLLNASNSKGSAYIDSLHHFLKQNNLKLQVEDIAVSNRAQVAVIAQTLRHEVGDDYKKELCEALSETKSIEIDPKRVELRWEAVALPSQPDKRAMMIRLYADPLIADHLGNQLTSTNRTVSAELYSKTYCWRFFQAKETDNPKSSLVKGIEMQLEFQSKHITAIVAGLGGMDLCNTIPTVDTKGKENRAQLTILNIMVGSDEFDRADEDEEWRPSPFIKVHNRGNGQYAFVGLRGEYWEMRGYLHDRFPQNLKEWFPDKMSERPIIHVYGFNPDSNDDESRCEISLASEENKDGEQEGTQWDPSQGEDTDRNSQSAQLDQSLPPNPSNSINIPNAPNLFDHPGQRDANVNTGQSQTTPLLNLPHFRNGLTSEDMEWILSTMMQHNSIRIGTAMEEAFKVVDPASRLVQALNLRDEKWYAWIWEGLSHMIYDAVHGAMEAYFAEKALDGDQVMTFFGPKDSSGEDDEPDETNDSNGDRPSTLSRETVERSQEQEKPPSTHMDNTASTTSPTENEKTNYQTPLSNCTALAGIAAFAADKELELERTQLSFDKYAAESSLSPINNTMDVLSPETEKL